MSYIKYLRGFTLMEMLVVIGLIALLATTALVAVNPNRQFMFARDATRKAHLASLLNAIGQNMAEHGGVLTCGSSETVIPSSKAVISSSGSASTFNLAPCLVPLYLARLPIDPEKSGSYYESSSSYDSNYYIEVDGENGHMTLSAESELDPDTPIVLTR